MSTSASDREGLIRPLVITATLLGIIQGITWTVLSMLAIFIYNETIQINPTNDSMGDVICTIYLKKAKTSEHIIIGPKEFNYFMYLYLVLSFCLLVTSSVMLRNQLLGKQNSFHNKVIGAWVGTVALVSLLDFILMCLIAHDYNKSESIGLIYLAAIGIVMAIAARGFVLWITNVIFAIILGRFCYSTYKKDATPNQPFIDAYETGPKPWLTHPTYDDPFQSGYDNNAFKHDQDNSPFPPRARQHPFADDRNARNNYPKETERNNARLNNNNNPYNNRNKLHRDGNNRLNTERDNSSPYGQPAPLRTAKIGRQGGQRSPPLNVPSPYIPDPDYSPPGSPRPRGVLRPKTNYSMY